MHLPCTFLHERPEPAAGEICAKSLCTRVCVCVCMRTCGTELIAERFGGTPAAGGGRGG